MDFYIFILKNNQIFPEHKIYVIVEEFLKKGALFPMKCRYLAYFMYSKFPPTTTLLSSFINKNNKIPIRWINNETFNM